MKKILAALLYLAPSLPAAAAPAAASDAADVRAVIERCVNSTLDVLRKRDLPREERKDLVMAVVEPVFNFHLMGKLTLGRAYWPKLSEAQRKEFTKLFVAAVRDSYYEKIDLFTDETVEFADPIAGEKDKFHMMTYLNSKGQRYKLLYKLHRSGSSWKVYDVEIEGISLVRTYGSQYDQVLRAASVKQLLAKMKEKSLETPEQLKTTAKKIPVKT